MLIQLAPSSVSAEKASKSQAQPILWDLTTLEVI